MAQKQKVLVCGDVEGQFNALFAKIANINKKTGPYDILLCVGNFFGVNNEQFDAYKNGTKKVPVPTYVLGPNKEEHVELYPKIECELCPNVDYLGKRGIFQSSGQLKIAYLSGIRKDNESDPEYSFDKNDATLLRDVCIRANANYRGIDILLTSVWPKNIKNLDENSSGATNITHESDLISWLAAEVKPRYHFSGLEGEYYERPPYRNKNSMGNKEGATRFLALARINNPQKQKWIYALNLTPLEYMRMSDILQQTTDETPCPYDLSILTIGGKSSQTQQYFYDMNSTPEKRKRNSNANSNKKPKFTIDQEKCWFCLQSPQVEKHLVISIGNEVYLALAKGGLVDEHILILPIEHHQAMLVMPDTVKEEVQQFKETLVKYYADEGKEVVFFERNFKTAHMQLQVIPVPKSVASNLQHSFEEEAESRGLKLSELEAHNRLDQVIPTGAPYFTVELPNDVILYTRVRTGFPLQFGREVLASENVLNMPDRVEWRENPMSRNEEEILVKSFRKKFEKFDFTLT